MCDSNKPTDADPLDDLVARFSVALLKKLKLAQANGRSGWEKDDWEADCRRGLLRHVEKGDPRDVAIYCAFMWHHEWITSQPAREKQGEPPADEKREAIARIIDPVAFDFCSPGMYGLKTQAQLEAKTMVGPTREIARAKADQILASGLVQDRDR